MQNRLIILWLFLFSYSGAILHSIIPHHHHDSHQEAREHHHHDHHSHTPDQTNDADNEQTNSNYFLTHTANADILINHISIDGAFKTMSIDNAVITGNTVIINNHASSPQVFHPPADDRHTIDCLYLFRALRAPPLAIA